MSSFLQKSNAYECKESVETATVVGSCPRNASEWNERSIRKNCSTFKHTCSSFEYHCVINTWVNETVEVCAPKTNIIGKRLFKVNILFRLHSKDVFNFDLFPGKVCAEYNYGGKTIQRQSNVLCKECPVLYYSVKSFLCK